MTSVQLYLGDCRDVLDLCVEAKSIQTTAAVALQHGRRVVGCDLNPSYLELARERIAKAQHG